MKATMKMWLQKSFHDVNERFPKVVLARRNLAECLGIDPVIEIGCGLGFNAGYIKPELRNYPPAAAKYPFG